MGCVWLYDVEQLMLDVEGKRQNKIQSVECTKVKIRKASADLSIPHILIINTFKTPTFEQCSLKFWFSLSHIFNNTRSFNAIVFLFKVITLCLFSSLIIVIAWQAIKSVLFLLLLLSLQFEVTVL